jgi:hypothetical protein
MGNVEWSMVGIGLGLMISEHSSFKIQHLTFDGLTMPELPWDHASADDENN